MSQQYFAPQPTSEHRYAQLSYTYRGHALSLQTDSGVFSKGEIDRGSDILLRALPQAFDGDVLDMGCGYGVIGLSVKAAFPAIRLTMADVNSRAVALCQQNARQNRLGADVLESDGFAAIAERRFDRVLLNPPIRAGKAVIYRMFADAARALRPGGELWIVIRKQQGAPSAITYLKTLYAKVEIVERESGYWVVRSQTSETPAI